MRFGTTWMLLGALMLGSVGCVAQSEVDRTSALYRESQDRVLQLEDQLEEAERRIAAMRDGSGDAAASREDLQRLREERDSLRQALDEAMQQMRELGTVATALPEELDADLERLAASNPDLMTYDADRGMIRFRSDFTFDRGSADVSDDATASLRRLAEVLQSRAAQPYEVRIVGHTDNVPIRNPATRERHPTNWHLSAHRAIAVKDVLESAGLNPGRMNVSGYGEYRPVEPHRSGGVEANRRVEIYLVAMSDETREVADNPPARQQEQGQGREQDDREQAEERQPRPAPQPEPAADDVEFK